MAQLNVKRVNRLLVTLFEEMRYLDDEGRDLPIKWNMMHMYSSSQLATDDSFVELLKDIDSLDRYLHGIKSEGAYIDRCKEVFNELGINFEIV